MRFSISIRSLNAILLILAAQSLRIEAQAKEQCGEVFNSSTVAGSDLASRRDAAMKLARKFGFEVDPSLKLLSEELQVQSLEKATQAVSRLPAKVYSTIREAKFRVVLVGESLRNMASLESRYKNSENNAYLDRAGLTVSDFGAVFVVAGKMDRRGAMVDIERITLHELGHAFDHSVGMLEARSRKSGDGAYSRLVESSEVFKSAHRAAEAMIKGTGIESITEFFADMFYFYFSSPKNRNGIKDNMPETYEFFRADFGL